MIAKSKTQRDIDLWASMRLRFFDFSKCLREGDEDETLLWEKRFLIEEIELREEKKTVKDKLFVLRAPPQADAVFAPDGNGNWLGSNVSRAVAVQSLSAQIKLMTGPNLTSIPGN